MLFEVKETTERIIDYIIQKGEIIFFDRYKGFDVYEDEADSKYLFIFFKDINKDLKTMQRFFRISPSELSIFEEEYKKFKDAPTVKYKKILDLKNLNDDLKNIYDENRIFFMSSNITFDEWLQMNET